MEVNMKDGIIKSSVGRVDKLKAFLAQVWETPPPTAREVARLTGYLLSMSLALGPVSRLRTRTFYAMVLSRKSWSSKMVWSQAAFEDLRFWLMSFEHCRGQPFWRKDPKVSVLSWSDASNSGWGGLSITAKGTEYAKGEWPVEVQQGGWSSTWRELRAVFLVLSSLCKELAGGVCLHRSDNQATVHIIQVGSSNPHLQEEALEIHKLCGVHGIQLVAEWVPRTQNELADYLSKVVDVDDWQLHPQLFEKLDSMWGPHTLDCFASMRTKQIDRFCSRWWNPGCVGIDVFTVDWSQERVCRAGTTYVLDWTSAGHAGCFQMSWHTGCARMAISPMLAEALGWSGLG